MQRRDHAGHRTGPARYDHTMRSPWPVLCVCLAALPAHAQEARSLLYFSGEIAHASGYAGAGWLQAPRGLDLSGPVFAAELGFSRDRDTRAAAMAGWRFKRGRAFLTVLAGIEAGPAVRPVAAADLWWEPTPALMATARIQATHDHLAWRAAAGLRLSESGAWIGPELAASEKRLRSGIHVTGIRLPFGFETRLSAGTVLDEPRRALYGELSVWRRF